MQKTSDDYGNPALKRLDQSPAFGQSSTSRQPPMKDVMQFGNGDLQKRKRHLPSWREDAQLAQAYEEKKVSKFHHLSKGAPFGTETDVSRRLSPQRSEYLETTSIGSKKKREIPTKIVNEEPPHSDWVS